MPSEKERVARLTGVAFAPTANAKERIDACSQIGFEEANLPLLRAIWLAFLYSSEEELRWFAHADLFGHLWLSTRSEFLPPAIVEALGVLPILKDRMRPPLTEYCARCRATLNDWSVIADIDLMLGNGVGRVEAQMRRLRDHCLRVLENGGIVPAELLPSPPESGA